MSVLSCHCQQSYGDSDIELEHGGGTLSQHGHNVCYGIVGHQRDPWYRAVVFDRSWSTHRSSSAGSCSGTSRSSSGEIASMCVVTLSAGEHRHCNILSRFKHYLVMVAP